MYQGDVLSDLFVRNRALTRQAGNSWRTDGAFIALGLLMAAGAPLIHQEFGSAGSACALRRPRSRPRARRRRNGAGDLHTLRRSGSSSSASTCRRTTIRVVAGGDAIWHGRVSLSVCHAIDCQLHVERLVARTRERRFHVAPYAELPDGTFVLHAGEPCLVLGPRLLPWITRRLPRVAGTARERGGDAHHSTIAGRRPSP